MDVNSLVVGLDHRTAPVEHVVPTIVAVRERLEDIRRQELERHAREHGPLSAAAVRRVFGLADKVAPTEDPSYNPPRAILAGTD